MIGNCDAPFLQGRIGVSAATGVHADRSRGDSAASLFGSRPGCAAERCPCGSGHARRLRVRRQGDREPPDGDLRRVRILRDARARRLHRPDTQPVSCLSGAGRRRRREHRPRDALLAERLGRGGCNGRCRLCDPLLGRDQRLLRRRRNLRAAHVHPSGHHLCPFLRGARTPGRLGAGGGGGNLCAHVAVAHTAAGRAPA